MLDSTSSMLWRLNDEIKSLLFSLNLSAVFDTVDQYIFQDIVSRTGITEHAHAMLKSSRMYGGHTFMVTYLDAYPLEKLDGSQGGTLCIPYRFPRKKHSLKNK